MGWQGDPWVPRDGAGDCGRDTEGLGVGLLWSPERSWGPSAHSGPAAPPRGLWNRVRAVASFCRGLWRVGAKPPWGLSQPTPRGQGDAGQGQPPPWVHGAINRREEAGARQSPAPPPCPSGVSPWWCLQYYSAGEETTVQFRHCRFLICLFIIQKLAHILMNP